MPLRRLRYRLSCRLILAVIVLALASAPLAATIMPSDGDRAAHLVPPLDEDSAMPCHGDMPVDEPCPNCGNPLHALCTCCPAAAGVALPIGDAAIATPVHARAPAAMGHLVALPPGPDERRFRPPIRTR